MGKAVNLGLVASRKGTWNERREGINGNGGVDFEDTIGLAPVLFMQGQDEVELLTRGGLQWIQCCC